MAPVPPRPHSSASHHVHGTHITGNPRTTEYADELGRKSCWVEELLDETMGGRGHFVLLTSANCNYVRNGGV